ncbi:MAG: N-acetylmuramoyl-L-alanine amidase [Bacteroidota bacterium]
MKILIRIICSVIIFAYIINFYSTGLKAQTNNFSNNNKITADTVIDDSEKRNSPASILIWHTNIHRNENNEYYFSTKAPIEFTSFGIGWEADDAKAAAGNFEILYRIKKENGEWTKYYYDEGYIHPSETPRKLYFTDLLFPPTEEAYRYIEFSILTPGNTDIKKVRLDLIDIRDTGKSGPLPDDEGILYDSSKACPEIPVMIPRTDWCGGYTACHNPTYSPTYINPTHTVIHHGASPDTYTDGYAVVRSYWNYHVNTLGWADIGYNYLFDKYGNFFQGRHNPNLPLSDVRGAHAGNSNGASIGINFLGNSDETLPTQIQLENNNQFLAWWYDYRTFDPTSSASITLQSGGTGTVARICGHKDVNIGGTTCPGNALYAELPGIRTNTKAIIDNCNEPNCDVPLTSISEPADGDWITDDFTAVFNDSDVGCGISRRFYQVLEYDGNYWGANYNRGFFGDNFDFLDNSIWNISTGNWTVNSGQLIQSDETIANTNIYAPLNQSLSNRYLYQFYAKVEGSGTNKRFGFHFFSDDASLSERGNSYFVWFRVDGESLQFYKVTNNTFDLMATESNITTIPGQWYDFKIIYDRISGEILVYRDDVLLGSWTDPSPYSSNGNYISFRTGNCQMYINEIKSYRTRYPEATISVGINATDDIRTESVNISTVAGKIKSIVSDDYENLSTIAHRDLFIDRTPPSDISFVNDGLGDDINEVNSTTELSANWSESSDSNSGIKKYWYSIGTEPASNDIVDWTDNDLNTNVTHTGLNLTSAETYYFNLRAENGAGLYTSVLSSNGQTVISGAYNLQHELHGCPDNEVTFSWSNSGSGWYIQISEYSDFSSPYWKWVSGLTTYTGPQGFESQSDGTPLEFIDENTYYWRINADGIFTSSLSFTLENCECFNLSEFPYFENFEGGVANCWNIENTASVTWEAVTSIALTESTIEPVSGSHFYRCLWTDTENQDEWFISPLFNIQNLSDAEFGFWFLGSYHWSVEQGNCDLYLMAKFDGADWVTIWHNSDHPDFVSNDINWTWLKTQINLSEFAIQQNVQFAFRYTGFDGATFAIDDIRIGEPVLLGDVNNDEKINVLDVVWMVQHIAGNTPMGFDHEAADITESGGEINTADLTALIDLIMSGVKKKLLKKAKYISLKNYKFR